MNIVYIAHRIPYPPNKGDKIRAYQQLKSLTELGDVYLFALVDDPTDWQYEKKLEKICKEVHLVKLNGSTKRFKSLVGIVSQTPMSVLYFYEKELQVKLDLVLDANQVDVICCYSGTSAEYIYRSKYNEQILANKKLPPHLVMDFCDVDSLKWREYSDRLKFPSSWVYGKEAKLMRQYEIDIALKFAKLVIITEEEKKLFKENVDSNAELTVVGNGVDLDYFTADKLCNKNSLGQQHAEVLFVGAMDYQANIDGVVWFLEHVWSHLVQKYEDVCFTIAGRNPVHEISKYHGKLNVTVTGNVVDIRSYYFRSMLVVVPLRIARGLQNKVLEAMATGNAVVSSQAALEGVKAVQGQDILVAESSVDYIDAVSKLIEDEELRIEMGTNARRCMEENYSWTLNLERFIHLVCEGVAVNN